MDAPAFRIDYRREGDLLRARVTGSGPTRETTLAYWKELAGEIRRLPTRRLLVLDELVCEALEPGQIAGMVQVLAALGFQGVRVAYVEAEAHRIADLEHGEIAAHEVGVEARVFDSEHSARIWLEHSGQPASAPNAVARAAVATAGDAGGGGFDISFRQDAACIIADVGGWIDSAGALIDLFLRSAGELYEANCRKLLVLDRTHGVVPAEADIRHLLATIVGSGLESTRVAYVDVRGTAVGRLEAVEILAREHGFTCRVFDNPQRARIWLDYGAG